MFYKEKNEIPLNSTLPSSMALPAPPSTTAYQMTTAALTAVALTKITNTNANALKPSSAATVNTNIAIHLARISAITTVNVKSLRQANIATVWKDLKGFIVKSIFLVHMGIQIEKGMRLQV